MPFGPFDPIIPQAPVKRIQDAIDSPSLERSPMEARLRGFGAGALEGLRQQITPVGIASMLMPYLKPGAALAKAGGATRGLAEVVPEVVEAARAPRQVVPMADDVAKMLHELKGSLSNVPASARMKPSIPEFMPTDAPVAPHIRPQAFGNPVESVYQDILRKGGR